MTADHPTRSPDSPEPRHTEGPGEVCDTSCPHWAWAESRRSPDSPDPERGLYGKYRVERIGGTPGKHDGCWYYVLDWEHDKYARPALEAYARACQAEYPDLAADLWRIIEGRTAGPFFDPEPDR
jgi:hypothetical protein